MIDVNLQIFDLREELSLMKYANESQAAHLQQLIRRVLALQSQTDLKEGRILPQHYYPKTQKNKGEIEKLLNEYRLLSIEQQRELPALMIAVGKLQFGIGEFKQAEETFEHVADITSHDASAQSEAHYNAYMAALERKDWPSAFDNIIKATALNPKRFEPFPTAKYKPQRILGAGVNGVAFLSIHADTHKQRVVKSLVEGDHEDVLREAKILEGVKHKGIASCLDCGYANRVDLLNPYIIFEHIEGISLEEHVKTNGSLSENDLAAVMGQVADAVKAAHQRGILHRDIQPSNILIQYEASGWKATVIDFHLAAGPDNVAAGPSRVGRHGYAAPEQLMRIPGVPVGQYSDVFSFGKTVCFALFGTLNPKRADWSDISDGLADLIERCTDEDNSNRLQDFADVLRLIRRLEDTKPVGLRKTPRQPLFARSFWLRENDLLLVTLDEPATRRFFVRGRDERTAKSFRIGEMPRGRPSMLFRLPSSCKTGFAIQLQSDYGGLPEYSISFTAKNVVQGKIVSDKLHWQASGNSQTAFLSVQQNGTLRSSANFTENPLSLANAKSTKDLLMTAVDQGGRQGPSLFLRYQPLRPRIEVKYEHYIDDDDGQRGLRVNVEHADANNRQSRPLGRIRHLIYRTGKMKYYSLENWIANGRSETDLWFVETKDRVQVEFWSHDGRILRENQLDLRILVLTPDGVNRALPSLDYQYLGALESNALDLGHDSDYEKNDLTAAELLAEFPAPVRHVFQELQNNADRILAVIELFTSFDRREPTAARCWLQYPQTLQLIASDSRLFQIAVQSGLPDDPTCLDTLQLMVHAQTRGAGDPILQRELEQLSGESLELRVHEMATPGYLNAVWRESASPETVKN